MKYVDLRYLTDEDFDNRILRGLLLRKPDLDVVRVQDVAYGAPATLPFSPLQREKGIEDSPDLAFEDWVRWGQGSADEEWVRFYVEHSCTDLYEWAKERGVSWIGVNPNEGNSVPRWHRPEGGGGGLWHALYNTAVARRD